jgi:MMP 1-O-methyltransferase
MFVLDRAKSINGWMSDLELEFLARAAKESETIVEFGCYLGRSTRALADNTKGIVYAVDPWNGVYYNNDGNPINILKSTAYRDFGVNLRDHIDSGKVKPYKLYSHEFKNLIPQGSADFVFIDGDHRKNEVLEDIQIAERLVRKGGIIAGHDYTHTDWPGVKQAVDCTYPTVGKVDSIWWIRKS